MLGCLACLPAQSLKEPQRFFVARAQLQRTPERVEGLEPLAALPVGLAQVQEGGHIPGVLLQVLLEEANRILGASVQQGAGSSIEQALDQLLTRLTGTRLPEALHQDAQGIPERPVPQIGFPGVQVAARVRWHEMVTGHPEPAAQRSDDALRSGRSIRRTGRGCQE